MKDTMKHFLASASLCCCLAFAATAGAQQSQSPGSTGGGACERNPYNCADAPNPLPAADTVWLHDMTWMDIRDAMAAGKKTVIIPTGGIEPNGPWLALAKHNYVLQATCDAIARKLGTALCAPIVDFVPNGDPETKSRYMSSVGTISVRQETYEALITDIARSMKAHGFENIIFISDNGGGNQTGQQAVAERLNEQWGAKIVHYVPEYYKSWEAADALLQEKGVWKKGVRDGLHDDPSSTTIMMVTDPSSVRWEERVKANKATIDGVSVADKEKAQAWGRELVELRANITVEAINEALAARK